MVCALSLELLTNEIWTCQMEPIVCLMCRQEGRSICIEVDIYVKAAASLFTYFVKGLMSVVLLVISLSLISCQLNVIFIYC